MRREFEIDSDWSGTRLETFLRKRLGLARPVALKALRKGWVRVDGRRAKGGQRLDPGSVVKITNYGLPLPAIDGDPEAAPTAPADWVERGRASVRFHDEHVVVSSKPSGVAVHKGSGHDHGWIDAVGAALGVRLTPVGRLDRDTSGLLVLSPSSPSSRKLFDALRSGTLARTYLALVLGQPKPSSGLIDRPLTKGGRPGAERMRVDPEGQPARTRYELREAHGPAALLACTLETGRTHQIRAHLHDLGHPLLGDPKYTTPAAQELSRELGLRRLFLHAAELRFPHPASGEVCTYSDPLPEALAKVLGRLKA